MNIALIFAGGSGNRMGTALPKQFLKINGMPVLVHTMRLFDRHPDIDRMYLAVPESYIQRAEALVAEYGLSRTRKVIAGGDSAQDTIYRLLREAASENPDDSVVLLHDGVRPFITMDLITRSIKAVEQYGSAVTCIPSYETVIVSEDGESVGEVPFRKETFTAQAPQSFFLKDILDAHDQIRKRPEGYENMVDACTILRTLGRPVHMVRGNRGNLKITTPEDVFLYRALLEFREHEETFGLVTEGI